MSNTLTKDEILALAKSRGVKLSFLNDLIGGYRGRLTDWKNGKATLSDKEVNIISDYLVGIEEHKTKHPPVKLPEGVVDKMIEGAIDNAVATERKVEVIAIKATAKEWFDILSRLSEENLIKLKEYAVLLLLQQDQAAQK